MYFLDKITLGDPKNPVFESYEYSPQPKLFGLPVWAALLILIALPVIAIVFISLIYGKKSQ